MAEGESCPQARKEEYTAAVLMYYKFSPEGVAGATGLEKTMALHWPDYLDMTVRTHYGGEWPDSTHKNKHGRYTYTLEYAKQMRVRSSKTPMTNLNSTAETWARKINEFWVQVFHPEHGAVPTGTARRQELVDALLDKMFEATLKPQGERVVLDDADGEGDATADDHTEQDQDKSKDKRKAPPTVRPNFWVPHNSFDAWKIAGPMGLEFTAFMAGCVLKKGKTREAVREGKKDDAEAKHEGRTPQPDMGGSQGQNHHKNVVTDVDKVINLSQKRQASIDWTNEILLHAAGLDKYNTEVARLKALMDGHPDISQRGTFAGQYWALMAKGPPPSPKKAKQQEEGGSSSTTPPPPAPPAAGAREDRGNSSGEDDDEEGGEEDDGNDGND